MVTIKSEYVGDLRVESKHVQSGVELKTDAPVDNCGKGESFSPTDLLATALCDCILTIMGIKAHDMGLDIKGIKADVTKVMSSDLPRRVVEVEIDFYFPKNNYTDKDKKILEGVASTCPVAHSIHPDIKQSITFNW